MKGLPEMSSGIINGCPCWCQSRVDNDRGKKISCVAPTSIELEDFQRKLISGQRPVLSTTLDGEKRMLWGNLGFPCCLGEVPSWFGSHVRADHIHVEEVPVRNTFSPRVWKRVMDFDLMIERMKDEEYEQFQAMLGASMNSRCYQTTIFYKELE